MLKAIAGVIVGYAIFAASAVVLFQMTHRDPHASPTVGFAVFSILYGMFFGALGGYVCAFIAGRVVPAAAMILAGLIAVVALISLIARPGGGAIWTQLAAILLFAPCAFFGGVIRARHAR